jgi:hypothetical protein
MSNDRYAAWIDVSRSWITPDGLARRRTLGPTIINGEQQTGDDRYVAVGE